MDELYDLRCRVTMLNNLFETPHRFVGKWQPDHGGKSHTHYVMYYAILTNVTTYATFNCH